jgi:hypothetical protein
VFTGWEMERGHLAGSRDTQRRIADKRGQPIGIYRFHKGGRFEPPRGTYPVPSLDFADPQLAHTSNLPPSRNETRMVCEFLRREVDDCSCRI